VHAGNRELEHSSTVLATRGKTFSLDGGMAKLEVAVR
jgi:hypothetical protein